MLDVKLDASLETQRIILEDIINAFIGMVGRNSFPELEIHNCPDDKDAPIVLYDKTQDDRVLIHLSLQNVSCWC